MATPHLTTPHSAARILVAWIEAHGREPRPLECTNANGLLHWTTFYHVLPGCSFSAMVSAAVAIVASLAAFPPPPMSPKLRTCLGLHCTTQFPDEGAHIRFCPRCRAKKGLRNDLDEPTPTVTRVQLKRWGIGAAGWESEALWEE